MYRFGNTSKRRMKGVRNDLIICATKSLEQSKYDMTIPWRGGYRTAEQQNELYPDATKADGYNKLSYHQSGNALDISPCAEETSNRAYNAFAQLMLKNWQIMLLDGTATGWLNWGGLFGSTGWDSPHWEVKEMV